MNNIGEINNIIFPKLALPPDAKQSPLPESSSPSDTTNLSEPLSPLRGVGVGVGIGGIVDVGVGVGVRVGSGVEVGVGVCVGGNGVGVGVGKAEKTSIKSDSYCPGVKVLDCNALFEPM